MNDLRALQIEASRRAASRGHALRPWKVEHSTEGVIARSVCRHCQRGVTCNTQPGADDSEISGDALSADCVQPQRKRR